MAVQKKHLAGAAILAALLSTAGGVEWYKAHQQPTIEEIQQACDRNELSGVVCEKDLLHQKDFLGGSAPQ